MVKYDDRNCKTSEQANSAQRSTSSDKAAMQDSFVRKPPPSLVAATQYETASQVDKQATEHYSHGRPHNTVKPVQQQDNTPKGSLRFHDRSKARNLRFRRTAAEHYSSWSTSNCYGPCPAARQHPERQSALSRQEQSEAPPN